MIESRKSEIRYRTDGPKKMLGKWLSKSVTKSWTETFKDEDTGKDVPVERTEVLFERGTYIDNDKLQQIMFFYDFDTSIFVDDVKSGAQKFIVYTNSVDKGLMIINAYLATKEKQRVQRMQEQYEKHQSEIEPADDLERKVIAAIEQVKPIPISRYIPLEFSMVYNEEK